MSLILAWILWVSLKCWLNTVHLKWYYLRTQHSFSQILCSLMAMKIIIYIYNVNSYTPINILRGGDRAWRRDFDLSKKITCPNPHPGTLMFGENPHLGANILWSINIKELHIKIPTSSNRLNKFWHLTFDFLKIWHLTLVFDIWNWLWNSDIDVENFWNVDINIEILILAFLTFWHLILGILKFWYLVLDPLYQGPKSAKGTIPKLVKQSLWKSSSLP